MKFDYEHATRTKYQSDDVASRYHRNYTQDFNLSGIRARLVAAAERRTISKLLSKVEHGTVLDIPTGTGKLAPIFQQLKSNVWACDISANMLDIARTEFANAGCTSVNFSVQDATDLGEFSSNQFDVVVCLRLLHRVPSEIRKKILSRLSDLAPYTLVSFGIDSPYHKVRRSIRSKVIGDSKSALCACTLEEARGEISEHFNIRSQKWVIPFLSAEIVFLLESKK